MMHPTQIRAVAARVASAVTTRVLAQAAVSNPAMNATVATLLGTLAGVEMGLGLAGVPHTKGGVQAAMDLLGK